MEIFYTVLVVLHFVGLASLLGGFLVQMKSVAKGEGRIVPAMVHGALTQLVTGLLIVGVREMFEEMFYGPLDMMKISVKLGITIIVTALVFSFRKKDVVPAAVMWAIGGLTLANVVIAVAWR